MKLTIDLSNISQSDIELLKSITELAYARQPFNSFASPDFARFTPETCDPTLSTEVGAVETVAPELKAEDLYAPPPPAEHPRLPTVITPALLDSAGVAWDPELHSESQSKVADGTWRKRRNASNKKPEDVVAVPTPPILLGTVQNPIVDVSIPVLAGGGLVPPPPPVPATELPIPVTTFRELMVRVSQYFSTKALDTPAVMAICKEHGIATLQDCHKTPDLIPMICTALDMKALGL